MNKICLFLIALFSFFAMQNVYSQANKDIFALLNQTDPSSEGLVQIHQKNNIRNLVAYHLVQKSAIEGVEGYRISIFRESGQTARANADKVRSEFLSKYEDIKCYKTFENPYYKLYVGDFRTKSEALKFYKIIEYDYPNAFIRKNTISVPE